MYVFEVGLWRWQQTVGKSIISYWLMDFRDDIWSLEIIIHLTQSFTRTGPRIDHKISLFWCQQAIFCSDCWAFTRELFYFISTSFYYLIKLVVNFHVWKFNIECSQFYLSKCMTNSVIYIFIMLILHTQPPVFVLHCFPFFSTISMINFML